MPAASHVEKAGTFTNTQRLIQFRDKALDPPGDARSELWFMHHLFKRVQAHYAGSTVKRDWPIVNLKWDYAEHGPAARARRRGRHARDQRLRDRNRPARSAASPSSRTTARRRAAAGSTPASSPTTSTRPGGATRATPRDPAATSRRSGRGRGRPTAGCSTRAPAPTRTARRGRSARSTSGGTRTSRSGRATTSRTSRSTSRRTTGRRRTPRAWTRSAAPTRSS